MTVFWGIPTAIQFKLPRELKGNYLRLSPLEIGKQKDRVFDLWLSHGHVRSSGLFQQKAFAVDRISLQVYVSARTECSHVTVAMTHLLFCAMENRHDSLGLLIFQIHS